MREYNYRSVPIPTHLNSSKITKEFELNIKEGKYISSNTPYSDATHTVKDKLKELYNNKCAYCESTLSNSYGEIEHYRPKKSSKLSKCDGSKAYYWLAFSWDNLLPCCKKCNISKSNCFDTFNNKANYLNENFKNLHSSLIDYNNLENPKLLHPEIDSFEDDISFSKKGEMLSSNEKVIYTKIICKLDRPNLKEAREKICTEYEKCIKKNILAIIKLSSTDNISKLSKIFKINIKDEVKENLNKEKEYSIVSYYIYHNFDIFIDTCNNISYEDKKIAKKLWKIC